MESYSLSVKSFFRTTLRTDCRMASIVIIIIIMRIIPIILTTKTYQNNPPVRVPGIVFGRSAIPLQLAQRAVRRTCWLAPCDLPSMTENVRNVCTSYVHPNAPYGSVQAHLERKELVFDRLLLLAGPAGPFFFYSFLFFLPHFLITWIHLLPAFFLPISEGSRGFISGISKSRLPSFFFPAIRNPINPGRRNPLRSSIFRSRES